MKLFQVWDSEDMAMSDSWWPTLKQAIAHVRDAYGITGPIKLTAAGDWEAETEAGWMVYIERSELQPTREGICHALKHWPNR